MKTLKTLIPVMKPTRCYGILPYRVRILLIKDQDVILPCSNLQGRITLHDASVPKQRRNNPLVIQQP